MICDVYKANIVYLPCRHAGLCYECSIKVWKLKQNCFICRESISEILEIEFSSSEDTYLAISRTTVKESNN